MDRVARDAEALLDKVSFINIRLKEVPAATLINSKCFQYTGKCAAKASM
jgi:hypothetical protein